MPIIVNLDVMLAKRKMRSRDLAAQIGIAEQNVSLLKSGKVKGVRFDTLEKICEILQCQPGDILEYRPDDKPRRNECARQACRASWPSAWGFGLGVHRRGHAWRWRCDQSFASPRASPGTIRACCPLSLTMRAFTMSLRREPAPKPWRKSPRAPSRKSSPRTDAPLRSRRSSASTHLMRITRAPTPWMIPASPP